MIAQYIVSFFPIKENSALVYIETNKVKRAKGHVHFLILTNVIIGMFKKVVYNVDVASAMQVSVQNIITI